jgi:hypothetical protein
MIHFPMSIKPAASTLQFQQPFPARRFNASTLLVAAVVTVVAGLLYFLTAARDIVVGDSPELTMAATTLGVAHPPGYPLFTMLGHLFSLMPLGPVPFRVNLLSVVSDALTAAIVFLTAFRLSRARLASAVGALVLALNPLFWSWSLVAEVFPLNNLLASLLIYLLVVWSEEPKQTGTLMAACFIGGLAITNHQTIVLLTPAVCFLFWCRRAALFCPRSLALCLTSFLVGLLPYAYVPWAAAQHPAYSWGEVSSLSDLFSLITRQNYGTLHLTGASHQGGSALDRVLALCVSFGPLMGFLGLLGLVRAYRQHRWYFWFSLLAFIFAGPFFVIITNLNLANTPQTISVLERFFLLPMVTAAPLFALGIVAVGELINTYRSRLRVGRLHFASGAVAIILVVSLFTNYRRIDQSHNHVARTYAEDVFATVEPGTILLVTGDGLSLPLLYLNVVEQTRPDVTLILPLLLPGDWYVRQLRERYPHLAIPFQQYDGQRDNLKALIDANPGRPVAIVGALRDHSLDQDHWAYLYGLVNLLEPRAKRIMLSQMVRDTEELIQHYRPPPPDGIKWKSFESEILSVYAEPARRIGEVYQSAGHITEARAWYQRALALDPDLPDVRQTLAKLNNK